LSLIQGAVTITLDGTEMHEDISIFFFSGDKAKTLGIVKPLYRAAYTITHTSYLGSSVLLLLCYATHRE
jgi:hypothetical protein